ncbi:hypothetical protein CBR_g50713 [Chara braunii]|uniref:Bifunctional inhibitor/plant lipid transfer protein/seed storage helical domain-containing protein n=1 Tax=Chara braunii TaxID=69332 RepID=A0A388K5M6_CHABU|nr:hypothetical protein CBR_g50713 [Chara braunii]|eukprot:GBG65351.1 hypothetical protein CBR_g50713 [Chara braunii]
MNGAMVALAFFGVLSVVAASGSEDDTDVCDLANVNLDSLKGPCDAMASNLERGGECCSKIDALMAEVLENSRFNQECGVQLLNKLAMNGYPMIALDYVDKCLGDERRALQAESSSSSVTTKTPTPTPAGKSNDKAAPSSHSSAPAAAIPILMQLACSIAISTKPIQADDLR